ncbi:MAG TPA: LuxR C-terminal-related transcriptional regulator [Polyangiaceae bacterium]|nr:LuxR C-terminal-related transcriptional regulator [Polyangiaceae bacterium]
MMPESSPHSDPHRPFTPHALWDQVTGGDLRIVDWYDRDGRRYLVARRVEPGAVPALTDRQKRALAMRSTGTALKVVAFELGVSLSTVARDVDSAMTRLGLKSQGDLAAVLGHAAG